MCGEKKKSLPLDTRLRGSPPRVRGEGNSCVTGIIEFGITPACAGRRRTFDKCTYQREDHPRVCGEKGGEQDLGVYRQGSPPRVRGEAGGCAGFRDRHGITPACAGRSYQSFTKSINGWDHPRVCGEKFRVARPAL